MNRAIDVAEMITPLAESSATASIGEPRRAPMSERAQAKRELERAEGEGGALPLAHVEQPAQRTAHDPYDEPRRQHLGVPPGLLPLAAHHGREEPRPAERDRREDRKPAGEQDERRPLGEAPEPLRLARDGGGPREKYLSHRLTDQHGRQDQHLVAQRVQARRRGAEAGGEQEGRKLETPDVRAVPTRS